MMLEQSNQIKKNKHLEEHICLHMQKPDNIPSLDKQECTPQWIYLYDHLQVSKDQTIPGFHEFWNIFKMGEEN